ncbi:TNF receptor-associated factor 3-like [Rhipicephalus sanguineus]|uniref:TNF receptor-associated factor 3-like n=1 Tax=Rhipicephalus sanguineus TaxID=34632 RepID=UPI0020C57180|nr:TNF receptor-associated factor 3-like [Rhipicephalus sanguineus]
MPTQRHRYTLVGFSDELDWRELNFVEPIPWSNVCQACGLVTRVTALLPCRHVFCKKCYEQRLSNDGHCCPLDGHLVAADDIEWVDCPVHNLLKRKVKCWNEDRGCDIVLPASELNRHFCKDCDHHSTCCPRCSMVVRCNYVCTHLQSECRDHVMSVVSGSPPSNISGENALMMALNANIETRVGEMKERLDHLTNENNVQSNRLNEISHSMNAMRETLLGISNRTSALGSVASFSEAIHETLNDHGEKLEQLAGTISNSHEALKEGMERSLERLKEDTANCFKADLRQFCSGEGGALTVTIRKELEVAAKTIRQDCAQTVARIVEVKDCEKQTSPSEINSERTVALSRMNVKRHEFVVEGFRAMKKSVCSCGSASYWTEKKYISGHHLSTGVRFTKDGERVYLYPLIQLHKGVIDDVLQWPFKEKIRLIIKHPFHNKECRKEGVPFGHSCVF